MQENSQPMIWYYFKWHYGKGFKEAINTIKNFLWFVAHFFSFKLLFKTLFSPWKRMGESYGEGFDLGAFASAFIVNSLMRVVGFITRIIIIFVGLVTYVAVLLFGVAVLFIWMFAPVILMGCVLLAVTFIIV